MKIRSAIALFLLAAGALAGMGGCGGKEKVAGSGAPPTVTGLTLQSAAISTIPEEIEAVGTVKARNSSVLAARVPGTVSSVLVKEGERVAKGKLLLTLEANEVAAGAAGARAAVEEASRGVEDARSRKKLADATFDRYQKLFQEQAVTRQEFDVRRTEKEVADQGVARAEARLAQAREGAKSAGTMAGYTRISAPIAGVVTAKPAEVGMTVFPGTPLVTVEEEGSYRLEVAAPESLLGKVKPGDRVRVLVEGAAPEATGRVAEVVPAIDPSSRTFTVKVEVAAKGVRSGTYGRAYLPVGARRGILVPKSALVERGALASVWVVDRDNVVRMRLVKVGEPVGDRVEILSGLSADERIVVGGVEKVVDGAVVK